MIGAVDHGGGAVEQRDLVDDLISRASSMTCWPSTTFSRPFAARTSSAAR
jgi:hypothetical protein